MPVANAATMIRSGLSPANSCSRAASSSPTSASAGSLTSSKKSWNWRSGETISIGMARYSKPGVSRGTMNRAGLSLPVRASSVRATTITESHVSTADMKTLRPFRIQSAPSRRAVVVIRCEFEPASGSVMPKAMRTVPSANPGRWRRFCCSVPKRAMMLPQIAGVTTSSSSGQPAVASSSSTTTRSAMPPPPPPYSSGRLTPR